MIYECDAYASVESRQRPRSGLQIFSFSPFSLRAFTHPLDQSTEAFCLYAFRIDECFPVEVIAHGPFVGRGGKQYANQKRRAEQKNDCKCEPNHIRNQESGLSSRDVVFQNSGSWLQTPESFYCAICAILANGMLFAAAVISPSFESAILSVTRVLFIGICNS